MLECFKYENHLGEVVQFGENGVFANSNDLRDYSWRYDSDKNKIENFRKGVVNKTIPIVIAAPTEEEGVKVKNKIFEVFEKDVVAGISGKIIIGEYYMNAYIYASKKSEYLKSERVLIQSVTVASDKGVWIKVTRNTFGVSPIAQTEGKGYPYGYEHDYSTGNGNVGVLKNRHFAPCDFVLKISGYVMNPSISIDGHSYSVNETIQTNEVLTIDSKKKTITLTKNNGEEVNLFSKRDKSSYIFEKIPSGNLQVYWNSGFNFEVTLYEERSEPKWI